MVTDFSTGHTEFGPESVEKPWPDSAKHLSIWEVLLKSTLFALIYKSL